MPVLIERLQIAVNKIVDDYTIVLIDDGSKDNSWDTILQLKQKHAEIFCMKLKQNYGQHQAIRAGIETVSSQWFVIMDCDLQDNPDVIPDFQKAALDNKCEVVLADRLTRKGRLYYKLSSIFINAILSILLLKKMHYRTGNFGFYAGNVIEKMRELPYQNFYLPVAVRKVTRSITEKPVLHSTRFTGKSSYTFSKHIALAFAAIQFAISKKQKGVNTYLISDIVA